MQGQETPSPNMRATSTLVYAYRSGKQPVAS